MDPLIQISNLVHGTYSTRGSKGFSENSKLFGIWPQVFRMKLLSGQIEEANKVVYVRAARTVKPKHDMESVIEAFWQEHRLPAHVILPRPLSDCTIANGYDVFTWTAPGPFWFDLHEFPGKKIGEAVRRNGIYCIGGDHESAKR